MSTPGFTAERALAAHAGSNPAVPGPAPRDTPSPERVLPQAIHWGSYPKSCYAPGVAEWGSILWGIPWGQSWETTCATTLGSPPGVSPPRVPNRCWNSGLNEWGYWYVSDSSCCIATGDCVCAANDSCLCAWECASGTVWENAGVCGSGSLCD